MCVKGGLGSSVGIVTDYGLDGRRSNSGRDEIFYPSRPALGPTQPPVKWVPVLSRGVKCGRGVLLTTHPLLVPRSWKSRAIPLPALWASNGITLPLHYGYHVMNYIFILIYCGPGSSVSIMTDCGLVVPGSNPGGDEIFRPSRPALGPTQPPV